MALWEEPVRDVRPVADLDRQRLLEFLSDLTDAQWLTATAAPGWTVRDVCLHLLDDDLTWLSMQRDGELSGLVDMSDPVAFPRLLSQKNQRWIDTTKTLSRPVVRDLLRWTGGELAEFSASADLMGEGYVSWASDASVPYWFNLAQEFTERWVHQQQIREAVGRVEDHEDSLPDVLRTFVWAFPHQLPSSPRVRCVEVGIDGVDTWTLTRDDDQWSMRAAQAPDADARLRMTGQAAWRLLTGAAVPPGGLTTEGPEAFCGALTSVRAIIV